MAYPSVTVTVMDGVYFKKTLTILPQMNLAKLTNRYCDYFCRKCSAVAGSVEFWYETTKINPGHTAHALGIETGDIIDVRIIQHVTRYGCPLPPQQRAPNLHYLPVAPVPAPLSIIERSVEPLHHKRVSITIKEINGYELALCLKLDTPFERIMQAFAAQLCMETRLCRFLYDDHRILKTDTPEDLEMEDGDLIEVFYEVRGGGNTAIWI